MFPLCRWVTRVQRVEKLFKVLELRGNNLPLPGSGAHGSTTGLSRLATWAQQLSALHAHQIHQGAFGHARAWGLLSSNQ